LPSPQFTLLAAEHTGDAPTTLRQPGDAIRLAFAF